MEKTYSEDEFEPKPSTLLEVPWHAEAACCRLYYDTGDDLFFAETKQEMKTKTAKAKSWCEDCPVKRECLTSALEHRDRFGVWGGLTVSERKAILDRIDAHQITLTAAVNEVLGG